MYDSDVRYFLSCVSISVEGVNERREKKSHLFSDLSKEKKENLKDDFKVSVVFPTSSVSHELCFGSESD